MADEITKEMGYMPTLASKTQLIRHNADGTRELVSEKINGKWTPKAPWELPEAQSQIPLEEE